MNEKMTANLVTKRSQLKKQLPHQSQYSHKSIYKILESTHERVFQYIKPACLRPTNNNLTIYTGRKSN